MLTPIVRQKRNGEEKEILTWSNIHVHSKINCVNTEEVYLSAIMALKQIRNYKDYREIKMLAK